jgi:hypothetical protein
LVVVAGVVRVAVTVPVAALTRLEPVALEVGIRWYVDGRGGFTVDGVPGDLAAEEPSVFTRSAVR